MRSIYSAFLSHEDFIRLGSGLARRQGADLLLSPEHGATPGWSCIGLEPHSELVLTRGADVDRIKEFAFGGPGPVLGFFSYDYGLGLRSIPSLKPGSGLPLVHLKRYRELISRDPVSGRTDFFSLNKSKAGNPADIFEQAGAAPGRFKGPPPDWAKAETTLGRGEYMRLVEKTLELIRSGLTYQLNLSTKFSLNAPGLDSLDLFLSFFRTRPARFYAWFSSGKRRILSTSPERFIRVRNREVLSQPIKGTLRIDGPGPHQTSGLTGSDKESAELSMIVDLIRNDVSANCEYGSVRVEDHKSVFRVDNLLQMYSNVRGRLRGDRDCLDLFLDAFPGGSVTGCPKKSSMGLIEELEPHAREIYCGCMVLIHDQRNMDSSIAIRTALYDENSGSLNWWAGSGLVIDSDPELEYLETMAKAEKFLNPERR